MLCVHGVVAALVGVVDVVGVGGAVVVCVVGVVDVVVVVVGVAVVRAVVAVLVDVGVGGGAVVCSLLWIWFCIANDFVIWIWRLVLARWRTRRTQCTDTEQWPQQSQQ